MSKFLYVAIIHAAAHSLISGCFYIRWCIINKKNIPLALVKKSGKNSDMLLVPV